MNNEYDKFHRSNPGIISDLIASLDALIDRFDAGIVPGEPLKSDVIYLLETYINALDSFNKVDIPVFQRLRTDKCVFNEENAYKELSGLKDSISLLLRMGREIMIDAEDAAFKSEAGLVLMQGNYCDEVILDSSGKHYYALSEKAEKALKNKNFMSRVKKENALAVFPGEMILSANKWSELYVNRIELLGYYYSGKEEDKEYILFTLDEAKEMVFGCELSDSLDVKYTFAGIFDEKIDDHVNQLKGLADSGRIDNITILIESQSMAEILRDKGINSKETPHISIEALW